MAQVAAAQVAAVPGGKPRRRPLLVFLHGRGGGLQESNANDAFFKALAALGASAPAVVFPSGVDHSYWHKRSSGDWPRYVLMRSFPPRYVACTLTRIGWPLAASRWVATAHTR